YAVLDGLAVPVSKDKKPPKIFEITTEGTSASTAVAGVASGAALAFDVKLVKIRSQVPGFKVDERPDGTKKGRALLVSGIHPREWMAYESLVRRIQKFHTEGVEDQLLELAKDTPTKAGGREAFFAEN